MTKKVQSFPVVLFGSVVALILSVVAFRYAGEFGLLGGAFLLYVLLGLVVSLKWPLNPWRIGVISVIPALTYLVWRWFTLKSPEDIDLNTSLFVFLPIISLATSYFGGFIGRSIVIRRMKQAHLQSQK